MYVLASASPRRRELLQLVLPEFAVCPADCDESCTISDPEQLVMELSRRKCRASRALCAADDVVIAADTLVFLEDTPLGKPRSEAEAREMLARLSGRTHRVLTAYTLWGNGQEVTRCISTDVIFFPLTAAQIAAYVATGEPMDKAGSYGIQGKGALLVQEIRGDYYNVVGLPVSDLARTMAELGLLPEERSAE
jgi:septum formation protein